MEYKPPKEILERYADVLINFALNDGKGINEGDIVLLQVPECAKPILISLWKAVMKSGGHPILQYLPDDITRDFYEMANDKQLRFFPEKYLKGRVDEIDHSVMIIADTNKHELEGIDPKKIMIRNEVFKPYKEWKVKKENEGKFTWTLAIYGTGAMAKEVGMSLKEYWNQIIEACYLDFDNPLEKWKDMSLEINRVKDKLNELKIEKIRVVSDNTDLIVGLGKNRKWLGARGSNIPSYEVFISPDFRKTNGYVSFNQPLYRYGNMIDKIYLEFKDGEVSNVKAKSGENILKEMIEVLGANRIGEFSLTDSRLSRVTKLMGETLYEENRGGKFGNMHMALGKAYQDSYPGDPSKVSESEWNEMGYNDSVIHTDMVSTEDRQVTAYFADGTEKLIYKDGKFVI